MKTNLRLLRLLAALAPTLALPVLATAQSVFTVTATANSSMQGYVSGQSYTFIYTTGASYPTAASFGSITFNTAINGWGDNDHTDPALWVSLTGTGVTGTYTHDADTVSGLSAGSTFMQLTAYNASLNNGLKTPANGTVNNVYTYLDASLTSPTFTSSYVDPVDYFSTRTGTYAAPSGSNVRVYYTSGDFVMFTANSLQVSAVPEPSTNAAGAGLLALVAVALRRRPSRKGARLPAQAPVSSTCFP